MKKISLLFTAAFIAALMIFTSCSDEVVGPTISVEAVGSDTAWRGDVVAYTVTWEEGDKKIVQLEIIPDAGSSTNEVDIEIDEETSYNYHYTVSGQAVDGGTISIVFRVTDKNDEVDEVTMTIIVKEPAENILSYTAVLMGAQSNTSVGSYLSTSDGTVYLQTQAEANPEKIDVIYYYGSTNQATLCAPDEPTVNGGTGNLSLAVGLTTQNATRFGISAVTADEFNTMTNDALLQSISGLNDSKMKQLAVGDIFAFTTDDGKNGLIKVSALETGSTGTITIDVKVQM